jgi:purine-binding chemotaxis protein CheW
MSKKKDQRSANDEGKGLESEANPSRKALASKASRPRSAHPKARPDEPVPTGSAIRETVSSRMPTSEEEMATLQRRADELVQLDEENGEQLDAEAYIRFRLGSKEHYGISHAFANEIIDVGQIVAVPCVPASVLGVVNRRGDLLTVLDLKQFFPVSETETIDTGRIIVVSNGEMTLGIHADEIIGEDRFVSSQLANPLPSQGVRNIQHVRGIHNGNVTILDMQALLSDESLIVDRKKSQPSLKAV